MKKLLTTLTVLSMILALAACGGEPSGSQEPGSGSDLEPRTLVVSSQLAAGDNFNTVLWPLVEEKVAEKTDGLLTFEYHYGATLCSADEQLEACSSGMSDISICTTALFQGQLPMSYMLEFPAYIVSSTAGSHAMMQWLDEIQPAEYEQMGVSPLMITTTGAGGIITMSEPIKSLEDFHGQELRGNSMMCDIVNKWGGTGVYISTNETYEAMRSGIVSGAVLGTDGIHTLTLDEIGNYYTYLPIFCAGLVTVINNDALNSLPEEWQTALKESFREAFEEACWYTEPMAQSTYETLESRGVEVAFLSDETLAEMEALASEVAYEYAAQLDAQGLNATEALDRFHEILDECNEKYPETHVEWLNEHMN